MTGFDEEIRRRCAGGGELSMREQPMQLTRACAAAYAHMDIDMDMDKDMPTSMNRPWTLNMDIHMDTMCMLTSIWTWTWWTCTSMHMHIDSYVGMRTPSALVGSHPASSEQQRRDQSGDSDAGGTCYRCADVMRDRSREKSKLRRKLQVLKRDDHAKLDPWPCGSSFRDGRLFQCPFTGLTCAVRNNALRLRLYRSCCTGAAKLLPRFGRFGTRFLIQLPNLCHIAMRTSCPSMLFVCKDTGHAPMNIDMWQGWHLSSF